MFLRYIIIAISTPLVCAGLPPCCQDNAIVRTVDSIPRCYHEDDASLSRFRQKIMSKSPGSMIRCLEYSVHSITDKLAPVDEACAAMYYYDNEATIRLAALQCKTTQRDRQPVIFHVNKCCNEGWSFDYNQRRCVIDETGEASLYTLLKTSADNDWLVAVRFGNFYCKKSLVDFEFSPEDIQDFSVLTNTTFNCVDVAADGVAIANVLAIASLFVTPLNRSINLLNEFRNICLEGSKSSPNSYIIRICNSKSYCENNFCLSKCCADNQNSTLNHCEDLRYYEKRNERKRYEERDYGIYVNSNCSIHLQNFVNTNWSIVENGHIEISEKIYHHYEYCLIDDFEEDNQILVVCYERDQEKVQLFIICILLQTSTFLVIPLVIRYIGKSKYTTLYEVYFVFLAVSYIAAVVGITVEKFRILKYMNLCTYLGYQIIFFTLSSFFWFTMMSNFILNMFKKKNLNELTVKNILKSRTFYFNLVNGWGLSAIITFIIIFLNAQMGPSAFSPNINSNTCWFAETYTLFDKGNQTAYGELIYYNVPTLVVIIINAILMIKSSFSFRNMWKQHKTDDNLHDEFYEIRKILFIEQLILVIVIGCPWLVVLVWKTATIGYYSLKI